MPDPMKRFHGPMAVIAALGVAIAASAGGASAAKPATTRLDPSFGSAGKTLVSVPKPPSPQAIHLAMTPKGESYVLDGSLLLAFDADGKPDTAFGKNGRVRVAANVGATKEVADVAVDSQGRVLVTGTVEPDPGAENKVAAGESEYTRTLPPTEAFVIRYLPDGARDAGFGVGGEVNSTFGAPRVVNQPPYAPHPVPAEFERPVVKASTLVIAAGDQPVVGGSYLMNVYNGYGIAEVDQAFAVRLAADGGPDPTFGGGSFAKLSGAIVRASATGPGGVLAALAFESSIAGHGGPIRSVTTALAADGSPVPGLDPARPAFYARPVLAVDGQGRMLVGEATAEEVSVTDVEFGFKYPRLLRLLPNGDLDTTYGHGGAAPLKPLGSRGVEAIAIDAKGRAVVGVGSGQWKLARVEANGKVDHSFAKGSLVQTAFGKGTSASLVDVGIDAKGRILAVGKVEGGALKTGEGLGLVRYLPHP
jgi:uncharacterized delta-60 repeat protein